MRAQLEASLAAIAVMKVDLTSQVQAFQTQNAAAVQTLTTSVAASVAAVEGDVANLSTTVSGLSAVATTGDFGNLTGRPSAVSGITVEAEQTLHFQCDSGGTYQAGMYQDDSSHQKYKRINLGTTAGRYCGMSKYRYTPRPKRGPRLQGTGVP